MSGVKDIYAQTSASDTIKNRFPVQKTTVENAGDLKQKTPIDLHSPSNIRTEVTYDYKTNRYIFQNKIGDTVVGIPFYMTPQQYMEYRAKQARSEHFRKLNTLVPDSTGSREKEPFSLFGIRKSNSILEEIFGPGGIQLTTQGSFEISTGIKHTSINNPTLPQRARRRTIFDFDPQIQLNVNAKVGNKVDFGLNYNTDAMFDFDAKRINLAYRGDEDEIIKNIEAGNVSMTTTNSLINGGAALFGVKSDLQFGKLRVNTVLSQQDSEARTINSRGGVQTTPFEFRADQYDENRHFFLGFYFRDAYDRAMSKAPFIQSAVSITRMEVWITNKRGNYDQARNIVAFADLGEHATIHNPAWTPQGSVPVPYNEANTLYQQLISAYNGARDISQTNNIFPANVLAGRDYEKIENARLLSPTEYTFQPQLGYISLRTPLQADEVLAVAFEFTYNGNAYQVGEFSNNVGREASSSGKQNGALFLKLLKPVSLSPQAYTWHLMMKNIYSIGYNAYNIQQDRFKLNITYQSDTTGVYLNYIPEGNIKEKLLLRVMQLDRLNSKQDPYPDGIFDFLEGYTVSAQNGRIIFPVVEPFGSHLRKVIGNDVIAEKYVYQELYDSTLTVARQISEKNKFLMSGEYRGTSGSELSLNAMNVARGSVRVTAGGVTLTEGTDYTVDYISGTVNIINQAIIDSGTPVSITSENRSTFNMQRKTMMGINLLYDFSKDFSLGGTLMHYYEKPLTMKTAIGDESVKNTLWGANLSYKKQLYAITNLVDKLPFVEATVPSQFSANLEFAHMIPGHYRNKYTGEYSYLDDFETSTSGIDLRSPYAWTLSATPYNNSTSGLFPEAALSNNIDYGKNRAHMAWFYIDGIFTRRNSSLTPTHIKNDENQLSNHLVREVYEREIYPNKDAIYGQPTTIPVFNISYYPNERGPYNLDTNVDENGFLRNPQQRWSGITRRMDTRDFEAANIEYIEFWLMDPFVNDTLQNARGGDLYFNLGEISEDILKDGKKFFENGLPLDGDETAVGYTVWGKYPKRQSTVYAFDNSQGMESRRIQDVGLNGLNSEEEKVFPSYSNYLSELQLRLSDNTILRMQDDAYSPFNDPAGDKFRHYRGAEQDRQQLSILDRYKYYNGTEGNSLAPETQQQYSTASRSTPDVEDIDSDNTLNENETYYQYKVSLRPQDMVVGSNFIVNKREVSVSLRNGNTEKTNWYQFKIPIREYDQKIGNIQGFNNIRFMRMFLTNFEEATFLRFATLELVRSEWRIYTRDLASGGVVSGTGSMDVSAVNIEENGDRAPVNYVLPPGVTRILDPSQPQLRQENEQSLSLKISNLEPGDSRSVYKNAMYDLRRYKRLQLFVHAEESPEDPQNLEDGELSVFLRIGSDYRNNFYEYEIPLRLTPAGKYSSNIPEHQETVWMPDNMFDFPLEALTNLKLNRNYEKRRGSGVTYLTPYSEQDPNKPQNRMTIVGNPSLAEVKVMMIGVRNRSNNNKSGEIWVNELRLNEFDEKGGWAAQGNVSLAVSDIGTINVSGRKETVGFGALDQSLLERRNDDYSSINVALNVDLGRFFPAAAKISAPFYYSYSNQATAPQYDPLNQDIELSQTLAIMSTQQEKDSVKSIAVTQTVNKSLSLNNVKVDIKSENPMPYDPANFSFGYAYNENKHHAPETEYATMQDYRLQANYSYTPFVKPLEPFKNIKSKSGWLKLIKSLNFNYLPNNLQISSNLARNYQETQLRDLNAYLSGYTQTQRQYLTFSQNFYWDRDFSLTWDLTRNLKTSFRSGTIAEIEEPYLQVNKKINRADYEIWKDSVTQSIRNLGKPLNYEQTANITYTLPLNQIPILDWITASTAYNSRYRWERGALILDENLGNSLQNDMSLTFNGKLNFVQFYNKIPFLQQANKKFEGSSASTTQLRKKDKERSAPNVLYYIARGLMMVRSANATFGYKSRTDIQGFEPMIGDYFGQLKNENELIPGLGFAFGLEGGEQYIRKAMENNWLVINPNNITPAIHNAVKNLQLNATIEPFRGLSIDLNALYEDNRRTEMQYMYEGMPRIYGGSFAMTTVSLASAFEKSTPANNYQSATFDKFLQHRDIIASRLRKEYQNTRYPSYGFISQTSLSGQPFNPANGDVNPNSADVLIPAFLAAYTGKNPNNIVLTAFPNLRALLPNWDIRYNLLSTFPSLENTFKTVSLSHKYVSQYRVGSYTSFLNRVAVNDNDDLGYIRDVLSGAPVPSSPYDISAVSLIESFNPLIEAKGTFSNNMTVNLRMNKTRTMNLNISSYQIVETSDNDIVFGLGYRIADFNRIVGFGSNSIKADRRRPASRLLKTTTEQPLQQGEFNNDLNIRVDFSHKVTQALIRKIEDGFTQSTAGLRTNSIQVSAEYAMSRALTLRAFFDRMVNIPLVSSSAYPTANTSAGLSLRFNLNQ